MNSRLAGDRVTTVVVARKWMDAERRSQKTGVRSQNKSLNTILPFLFSLLTSPSDFCLQSSMQLLAAESLRGARLR